MCVYLNFREIKIYVKTDYYVNVGYYSFENKLLNIL